MNNKLIIAAVLIAAAVLPGCKKYLEVYPKSSISETQIFDSEFGFQQALTGVYTQMASQNLYGDRLTMGFISALAQDYGLASNLGIPLFDAKSLNYQSQQVMDNLSTIWNSSYNAIAGVNKVIINTETNRDKLTTTAYARIRGEALGLRAFLHFDLLRMFGPEYTAGASSKAIPYVTTLDQNPKAPSTTAVVIDSVLNDIAEAASLLKDNDSVHAGANAVNVRRIKMNYYAVKGLEARVRIYSGDKTGAFAAADEVVNSQLFPFAAKKWTTHTDQKIRDRLYLTELIFALRVRNMEDWVDRYFRSIGGSTEGINLNRKPAEMDDLYEKSATDIRRVFGFGTDGGALYNTKYWQTNTLDTNGRAQGAIVAQRFDQLVPLIRLSEIYYIMAEAATTPLEGLSYLNAVRAQRNIDPISATGVTPEKLEAELLKEYRKEFYAEGQLFFYYKRKNLKRMPFMAGDVALSVYRLPIPDSELEFNPNY